MQPPVSAFGTSVLCSAFLIVDVPKLRLRLRYAHRGLSPNMKEWGNHLRQIVERRNQLAPDEKMSIEVETLRVGVTEQDIERDKMEALKGLPRGFSALELGQGEPGRFLNQSIRSLRGECSRVDDITRILI